MTFFKDCGPFAASEIRFSIPLIVYDSNFDPVLDVGLNAAIHLQRVSNDTLRLGLDDNCFFFSERFCIQRLVYRRVVELPFIEGGYIFGHYLCCRNSSVNIHGEAFVFSAQISEDELISCADGMEFRDWPPLHVCVNEVFEFDHSITNPIGDSVVYSFCTPYGSGSRHPPFSEIEWRDTFNLDNLTGGDYPLKIDSRTGKISGIPVINGAFTVSVCAIEFKDGKVIRRQRRDFQFQVGSCLLFEAEFFIPDLLCGGSDLIVENLTREAKGFEWILRVNEEVIAVSNKEEPFFVIDPGMNYSLTLIALGDSENECIDTLSLGFEVLDFEYELELDFDREGCDFPLEIGVRYEINPSEQFDLEYLTTVFVPGRFPRYFHSDSFRIAVPEVSEITLNFRAIDQNTGCWIFDLSQYHVGAILEDGLMDSIFVCGLDYIILNESFSPFNEYTWSPPEGMLDPVTTPNPRVRPLEPITYTAQIFNDYCSGEISYYVTLIPSELPFLPDTICGTRTVEFDFNPLTDFAQNFNWRFYQQGTLVGSRIGPNPTYTFPAYGEALVELIPFRPVFPDCADTFRQIIYLYEPIVDLVAEYEKGICSDSIEIIISASLEGNLGGNLTYLLIINETDTFNSNTPDFSVWLEWQDNYQARLIVESDHGCQAETEFLIEIEFFPELTENEFFEICRFDTIQLKNPLGTQYEFFWKHSDFFISEIHDPNPFVSPDSNTVFELYILFDDCEYLYTFEVEVIEQEIFDLPDLVICDSVLNHILQLPDIGSFDAVNWIIGDLRNPEFTSQELNPIIPFDEFGIRDLNIIVSDSSSCGRLYQGVVILSDISGWKAEIETISTSCLGDEVEIIVNGFFEGQFPDGQIADFYWLINGEDTIFVDGGNLELNFTGIDEISIELVISDEFGCSQSSLMIQEFDLIGLLNLTDSLMICLGDTVNLLPDANPDYSFVWSPAFGFISPLTDSNPLVSPVQSIQYTANISSDNCEAEQLIYVEVIEGPSIISVSSDPEFLFEPGESFLNVNISGDFSEIIWSPEDLLDNPFVRNPVAYVEETTIFWVIVSDDSGCLDSAEITIMIEDRPCAPPFVFVPNAFSPNGDGMNDVLYVRGDGIISMEMRIYNRYGQEVFYSNDQSRGWDGKFGGEAMPAGVYAYHLLVECRDGVVNELSGSINIIR